MDIFTDSRRIVGRLRRAGLTGPFCQRRAIKVSETMSDEQAKQERRQRKERRRTDNGPPVGFHERRVNIERRLFNLGLDCGQAWLNAPPPAVIWNTRPLEAEPGFSSVASGLADCSLR